MCNATTENGDNSMSLLIDNLAAFNRKERFHLLAFALDWQPKDMPLGRQFIDAIGAKIGCKISDSSSIFMAMDYHLDWLYAALYLTEHRLSPSSVRNPVDKRNRCQIAGTQEDIDLLVAFACDNTAHGTHLVLVEAKGDTSWSTAQLASKAKRLKAILPDSHSQSGALQLTPHFILASPSPPQNAGILGAIASLPEWARNGAMDDRHWIHLPMHGQGTTKDGFAKVVRCDRDGEPNGHNDEATHWKIASDGTN